MVHGTCAEHQHVLCSSQLRDSVGWNRPLHLLGVPFSYLKEQVYEEVLLLPDSPPAPLTHHHRLVGCS